MVVKPCQIFLRKLTLTKHEKKFIFSSYKRWSQFGSRSRFLHRKNFLSVLVHSLPNFKRMRDEIPVSKSSGRSIPYKDWATTG